MGLLDDAIREHLDLKRRHGADPTEIEREEREALGPVRRGPEEPDDLALEPAVAGDEDLPYDDDHDLAYEHEEEEQWHEPSLGAAEPQAPLMDEPETAEPLAPRPFESAHEPEPGESWAYDEQPASDAATSDPEPAPAAPQPHPDGPVGEETAEYNVDLEHDSEKEGDDMLEETPEFLQDAPDHDRLWFEQRPPRDFDFDG